MYCFQTLYSSHEPTGLASAGSALQRTLLQASTTSLDVDSVLSIHGKRLSEVGRMLVTELASVSSKSISRLADLLDKISH